MDRLSGKIALVTGAASGIGESIAGAFVAEGACFTLSDIRDDAGDRAAATLGILALYAHLDVRSEADWVGEIDAVLRIYGKLDVVVNNAGITGFEDVFVQHDPENETLENWRAVMATNLDGAFLGCKHAIRATRAVSFRRASVTRGRR